MYAPTVASNREKDFGLLISTILPGFVALMGWVEHSPTLRLWLGQAGNEAPSVGGFLLLTVACVMTGMIVTTIRWATIDWIHGRTGLKQPAWDFFQLKNREQSFMIMIDSHYRFYQFYANSIVAIPFLLIGRWSANGFSLLELTGGIAIAALFFAGSRDTLRKYYQRVEMLLAA